MREAGVVNRLSGLSVELLGCPNACHKFCLVCVYLPVCVCVYWHVSVFEYVCVCARARVCVCMCVQQMSIRV